MGVGARGLRIFGRRCQAELQHLLPRREPLDVPVAKARLTQRFKQVEAEVVRRWRESRIGEDALHQPSLRRDRNRIDQDGEHVGLLTICAAGRRVTKKSARRIPGPRAHCPQNDFSPRSISASRFWRAASLLQLRGAP